MKLKLKSSVPFFTPKKLALVYVVSLIICTALRVYHVLSLIEPQTGFFSKTDFTVPLFFTVLALSCAFLIIGAYLSKDNIKLTAENINSSKYVGIVSLLLSFGFFLDFGYSFVMAFDSEEAYSYTASQSFAELMRTGSLPRKAEMIFAALSFIYFLVFAIMVLAKKYKGQMKIFSLVTVFWGISRLVTLFVKQISFVRVSDLFLEIAATVFMTVFFFSFCECVSGVYREDAEWRISGIGFASSLCCLTIQIPRIIAAIIDNTHIDEAGYVPHLYNDEYILNYVEIFSAVLVIAIFIRLHSKQKAEKKEA